MDPGHDRQGLDLGHYEQTGERRHAYRDSHGIVEGQLTPTGCRIGHRDNLLLQSHRADDRDPSRAGEKGAVKMAKKAAKAEVKRRK
jgi:hypothetical protein